MIVDIRGRDISMQWEPVTVSNRVDLGTGLAAVYWAGPGQIPPLTARTCMLSTLARDQSI